MKTAGLTATGLVRSHNEDTIFSTTSQIGPLPNLFIVADGMGGHNAGEVASAKSVEYFCEFICAQHKAIATQESAVSLLVAAIKFANQKVYTHSLESLELSGMGTTFSACAVLDGKLAIAHIGDSRIYTVAKGQIAQITTDHTYVEEMIQAGHLTSKDAKTHPNRNQLTRVLGCRPPIDVDGALYDLSKTDSVLLCSDGLTDMLLDEEILNIASQNTPPQDRGQALIDAANRNGGIDNISVIIIDVKGETN